MCYLCRSSGGSALRSSLPVPLPVVHRNWWVQHVKILKLKNQNIVAYASSYFSLKGVIVLLPDFDQCILHTSDFMWKCVRENYDVYVMEPIRSGIYDNLLTHQDQRTNVIPNIDEYYGSFVCLLQLIKSLNCLQEVKVKKYKKEKKLLLNKYSSSDVPIYVYAKGLGCVVAARYITLKGLENISPAIYMDNIKDISIKSYYFCNARSDYWNIMLWTTYTWINSILFSNDINICRVVHIVDDGLIVPSALQARILDHLYKLPIVTYSSWLNVVHHIYTYACALVINCKFA